MSSDLLQKMLVSFIEFSGRHTMPKKGLLCSELCNIYYSSLEYILLRIPTVLES